jgi:hypothetical protein
VEADELAGPGVGAEGPGPDARAPGADTGVGRNAEAANGRGWTPGRVFAGVTVLPALLAAAWLVPGLPLLLAGAFDVVPMIVISVLLAIGLCVLVLPRLPATWPAGSSSGAGTGGAAVPWWPVAATVAVAVVFAGWQLWMHTQQVIYLRDPNIYLQTGYWIAHHGSLPIPQSLGSFGDAKGLSFTAMGYFPRGTGIVPQFMTGYPMAIAGAVWIGGTSAALLLTPIVGGCAILTFGGLAGRLVGARWAPAAAAVLALCLPQQYTSRTTFSEPLAEVLLFGSLCLLVDVLFLAHSQRGALRYRLPSSPKTGSSVQAIPAPRAWLAVVAGLALGLTILVRLDGLSDILPVVPFLGVALAARWREAVPFGLGVVIGVGYGLVDGYGLSRPYLQLEAPSLHPLALIAAAVVLFTVAGVAASTSPPARAIARRYRDRAVRWLPDAAAVVVVLVFIGFAVRPLVQTVAGETDPTSIAYVAELQKLAHLPINGKDQYYQDSLYWVIWYIGVPTVLLGALGLAALARRGTKALLTWQDPDGAARAWALPLMIALWVIVTVLWRPAVSPDQPWASRRLVPFVLPGLILGAVWAASWIKTRVNGRVTSAAVAACVVAALAIPTLWTTFGISLSPRPTAHGMAFKRIGAGELKAVQKLCGQIPADASVVILDQLTADRFAQVTRGMCDTPTAVLPTPTQAGVAAVIAGIERAGRRPVLLAESAATLAPYGGDPREVVNLLTTQEAHELTTAPERTWNIHYTVWMSTPGAT